MEKKLDFLHATWWPLFHRLWGLNKDGVYDKNQWIELQKLFEQLERDIAKNPSKELKGRYIQNFDRRQSG